MYNLVRFLIRYHLLMLFLLLEAFSFYLIFKKSKFHSATFLNTSNALNGAVFNTYNDITSYFYLRKSNDSLVAENAALRAMLLQSKYSGDVDTFSQTDSIAPKLIQRFVYFPAKVIRNSTDNANNILYIDKGSLQGVHHQMGVICRNGIVGQVVDVSDNYSAVMSVLNKDFKVSAKIKKNNYFGNLHWSGVNASSAKMDEIPKHVPVVKGDTIVSSGYSSLFPENVMIGIVENVKSEVDKPFMHVDVKLSTNFRNLDFVYVVKDLQRNEISKLDSVTIKANK
ncbi:MAG TPA: rod shape-determining protein MreC [Chitinophagales bacterium]|nr:rod shape-determining protein MreC [Chitinophagales bacterium]HRP38413.1 rod shape-determining protein MreC [Chitinophagales bacterium]